MNSRYGEPWSVVNEMQVVTCYRARVIDDNHRSPVHPNREEADRIVACVNFCCQFPTEFLEGHQLYRAVESDKGMSLAELPNFSGNVIPYLPVVNNEATR